MVIPSAGTSALLERERELHVLRSAVQAVTGGAARVVVVAGVREDRQDAALAQGRQLVTSAGLRVVFARGSEFEREFAFGVVRQLFERDVARAASVLAGAAAAAAVFEPADGADAGGATIRRSRSCTGCSGW